MNDWVTGEIPTEAVNRSSFHFPPFIIWDGTLQDMDGFKSEILLPFGYPTFLFYIHIHTESKRESNMRYTCTAGKTPGI